MPCQLGSTGPRSQHATTFIVNVTILIAKKQTKTKNYRSISELKLLHDWLRFNFTLVTNLVKLMFSSPLYENNVCMFFRFVF